MNGLQYALDLIDRSFSNGIARARNETRGLDNAVNNTNRNIRKLKSDGQNSFDGLASYAKKAGQAILAALTINAAISFGKEVTELTAKFEGMENAIRFASGQEASKNMDYLDSTIARLNLNMTSSYKGFQTLTGSLKGTALEGQATRDIFEGVGIAASVMNLSAEQSEGAFLALSQMASKGVVSAEELRGQLGERLPGAMGIAAKAMGVTQSKLGEMMQKGEVMATDFLPKFSKELKKTFEGGLPKAMESMQSALNKQENALTQFKLKTGETFRPLIIAVLEAGNKIFGFLGEMMNYTEPVKEALIGVGKAFQPVVDAIINNGFITFSSDTNFAKAAMEGIAKVIVFLTPLFEVIGKILGTVTEAFNYVRKAIYDNVLIMIETGTVSKTMTNIIKILTFVWNILGPIIKYAGEILGVVIGYILKGINVILDMINSIIEWGGKITWLCRLFNAWGAVFTSFFEGMKEVAVRALGSIGDLMIGIFTLDINKIKSGLAKGFDAVKTSANNMGRHAKAAYDGWNKELEKPIDKNIKVTTKSTTAADPAAALVPGAKTPAALPGSDDDKKDKKKKGRVSGSGSGGDGKHNTFNIQSFVKDLHIHVTNMKESPQEIKAIITQIFNEAVADIEIRANA